MLGRAQGKLGSQDLLDNLRQVPTDLVGPGPGSSRLRCEPERGCWEAPRGYGGIGVCPSQPAKKVPPSSEERIFLMHSRNIYRGAMALQVQFWF